MTSAEVSLVGQARHRAARSTAHRTAIAAAGQTAAKGAQVVLAVVLVRLLSPSDWNTTAYLLSMVLAAVTIGSLNLHQSLVFFLPRAAPDDRRGLVLRSSFTLACIGTTVGVGLWLLRFSLGNATLHVADHIGWFALAIACELPALCLPSALIGDGRIVAAAAVEGIGAATQIALVTVAAATGGGVHRIAIAFAVASAVRLTIATVGTVHWFSGPSLRLHARGLRAQLHYALPLGATLAVSVLNRTVDKWLVAAFAPGQLGVYAVAAQEVPLVTMLPYAGGVAVAAQLVDAFRVGNLREARRVWVDQTRALSRVVVPVSMALIVCAPEIMHLVIGDDYQGGVLPFRLFSAITLHRVAEYGLALRSADRPRHMTISALVLLGTNVVLAGLGASRWGASGASAGTLSANVVAWLVAVLLVSRALRCGVRDAFAWRAWAQSLLTACCAAAVALAGAAWITGAVPVGDQEPSATTETMGAALRTPAGALALKLVLFGGCIILATRPTARWRSAIGKVSG